MHVYKHKIIQPDLIISKHSWGITKHLFFKNTQKGAKKIEHKWYVWEK